MILYGLVSIAVLAAILVFTKMDETTRTAVFTLFGTIAGYLAGIRTPVGPNDGSGAVTQPALGAGSSPPNP